MADFTDNVGYDKELFIRRVNDAMHLARMDYDALAKQFSKLGYSITGPNLRMYINQRNVSLKVLIYLSKSLNVPMDHLVGNDVAGISYLNDNFDRDINSARYAQYPGKYVVYFYPTRTNEPENLIEASLDISDKNGFFSTLKIPVPNRASKIYTGHLVLSKKTNTAFLSMIGEHGEIIEFIFNDPNTIQDKIRFCVAALISVSSGDLKRMPTLSRAIICENAVNDEGRRFLTANLRLNSKYINIECNKLQTVLNRFLQKEEIVDATEVVERLQNAFKVRHFFSIEEQYFLNTFKNENALSDVQAEQLIVELRNHSMSDINIKVPRSIDSRLYLLMNRAKMFIQDSDKRQA